MASHPFKTSTNFTSIEHLSAQRRFADRTRQVTAKAEARRLGRATGGSISFSELAENPTYKVLAAARCSCQLREDLETLGMESAAEIASHRSSRNLCREVSRRGGSVDQGEAKGILARARREAIKTFRLMQQLRATSDPMAQSLRYTGPKLPETLDVSASMAQPLSAYANPASLQSEQSPAAYLRHLYRIATGLNPEIGLNPDALSDEMQLDARRPDLAELALSETNLKEEIPTVVLINEVLERHVQDVPAPTGFPRIGLPFDAEAETVRRALAQIGAPSLNDIAHASQQNRFPLAQDTRLAVDQAGLLGLTGTLDQTASEGSLLAHVTGDSSIPTLSGYFFNYPSHSVIQLYLLEWSFELEFRDIATLFGQYVVYEEGAGVASQGDYATAFFDNTARFDIVDIGTRKALELGEKTPRPEYLRSAHILVRLHKATGLAFHHLNWLLSVPGASQPDTAPPETAARRVMTRQGLRMLAGYPMFQSAFDMSVEGYAALFGPICPFWRADVVEPGDGTALAGLETTEVSFLRSLFDEDAPQIQRWITAGETPATDPQMNACLVRAFGLRTDTLAALVDALDPSFGLRQGVDALGLAALYRMITVFEGLSWPMESGLALCDAVGLLAGLTIKVTSPETLDQLASALDQTIALANWMADAQISPETLLMLLTPSVPNGGHETAEEAAFRATLAARAEPVQMRPEQVAAFTKWDTPGPEDTPQTVIAADSLIAALTGSEALLTPNGVFLASQPSEVLRDITAQILTTQFGIDTTLTENQRLLERFVQVLAQRQVGQVQCVTTSVAGLSDGLSETSAAYLMHWAQTTPLGFLDIFLGGGEPASFWLAEMHRHAAAVTALGLGDIDLWLLSETPAWLAPEAAHDQAPAALNLAQLYALQRFISLQVGPATDGAWRGYLTYANQGEDAEDPDQAAWHSTCVELLSVLLETPAADITQLIDVQGGHPPGDVLHLDALARQARLAQLVGVSTAELHDLINVANSDARGDWTAAASAAEAALARCHGGAHVAAFQKSFAEAKRDALVATLLASQKLSVSDRDSLSQYLLLDLDVTSAVPTSRIVEAINTLQTYIDRALTGLEPKIKFHDRDALQARWRIDKEYRLWEANEKLLLYPQNYIEPGLRYITSPEFEALQQAVRSSPTPDEVEAAVNTYMSGLGRVCDIRLCSFSVDTEIENTQTGHSTYHLLAKAQWEPGRYFYRKLDADYETIAALEDRSQYLKAMDWTFWQPVSVPTTFELLSDVSVCVFHNRYFFFWLELEKRNVQEEEGEESDGGAQVATSWRIHPRYMRCDTNSLTGPMHTPRLYHAGTVTSQINDGAFEWRGERPVVRGAYHPAKLIGAYEMGKVDATDAPNAKTITAMVASYGLELVDQAGIKSLSSLHLRLTDEWSDAIHDSERAVDTEFDDAGPEGYLAVYPRPRGIVNHRVQREQATSDDLSLKYKIWRYFSGGDDGEDHLVNSYTDGVLVSDCSFVPAFDDQNNLGSVSVSLSFGDREIRIDRKGKINQPESYAHFEELSKSKLTARTTITFETPDQSEDPETTEPEKSKTEELSTEPQTYLWQGFGQPNLITEAMTISTESLKGSLQIPTDWAFGEDRTASIKVSVEIEREAPSLKKGFWGEQYYTDPYTGKTYSFPTVFYTTNTAVKPKITETFEVATLNLTSGDLLSETAWTRNSDHGAHTFVHAMPSQNAAIDDTALLLISSSAMADLARKAPMPGGCEGLFAYGFQQLDEDLGTFVEDFQDTLNTVYPNDTNKISPDRLPSSSFEYDGAYGGYGWEVFYHIPSAIAEGYAADENFEEALAWMKMIFDPTASEPWRIYPLRKAKPLEGELAFDTGDTIIDPDRIAQDYPVFYQQATLRHYLEILIAAGDAAYAEGTQESLQRAKSIYISAGQFFSDEMSDTIETLTSVPWENPTLGCAAKTGFIGFLPPINTEFLELHTQIEERLTNLRMWLDIDGAPLSVPLLAPPIDPLELQKAGKAELSLRTVPNDEPGDFLPDFDFVTVARSAKAYIANLQKTSARLQAAIEKGDAERMSALRLDIAIRSAKRSVALQDLIVAAAEQEVDVKVKNLNSARAILAHHVGGVLTSYGVAFATRQMLRKHAIAAAATRVGAASTLSVTSFVKSALPTIFGMANGGADIAAGEQAAISFQAVLKEADERLEKSVISALDDAQDIVKLAGETIKLSLAVDSSAAELRKAQAVLDKEEQARKGTDVAAGEAQEVLDQYAANFSGAGFYDWMVDDLQRLFAEEWVATQEFCRILVQVYELDTGAGDGESFITQRQLGGVYERFNAPFRLALDVERMEAAYFRNMLDIASESSTVEFSLNDMSALGHDMSVQDALLATGEAYFTLTDEMFDVYYPGQYDRRIQSLSIDFCGLQVQPHARLVQLSNTRVLTPERNIERGAHLQTDRYPLQSLALSKAQVDTAAIPRLEGQLGRFQNTGVASQWHLSIPMAQTARRGPAAEAHLATLTEQLQDIRMAVTFAGRWSETERRLS